MRSVLALVVAALLAVFSVGGASPAQAAMVLDQSSTGSGVSYSLLDGTQWDAQTFTAGITGPLSKVDLKLIREGNPTSITVSIKAVNGSGLPTGPDLASEVVNASAIPLWPGGIVSVLFTSPITVTNGTQYAIYLSSCIGCLTDPPYRSISWASDFDAGYARGQAVDWFGGVLPVDFLFSTYVGAAEAVPSGGSRGPDDILQQVGLPSSGSCADVNEPSLNWTAVGDGGWTPSWAQWRNQGSGGGVCGRTLFFTPSGTWAVRF